jgi:hypothetical protein
VYRLRPEENNLRSMQELAEYSKLDEQKQIWDNTLQEDSDEEHF